MCGSLSWVRFAAGNCVGCGSRPSRVEGGFVEVSRDTGFSSRQDLTSSSSMARLSQIMGQKSDEVLQRSIEASKVHWSQLKSEWGFDPEDYNPWKRYTNREIFEELRTRKGGFKEWLQISEDVESPEDLVMGEKLAEGGQAEIFEVKDCRKKKRTGHEYVLKVFKKGFSLGDLQYQWPDGLLLFRGASRRTIIQGAMIVQDDRFAFLLKRRDIDLKKLIDIAKERNSPLFLGKRNRRPLRTFAKYEPKLQQQGCSGPIFNGRFVASLMHCIAYHMYLLHDIGVIHGDLKASNILCSDSKNCTVKSADGYGERCINVDVADFESSQGVVGTGFWRAPEILQQLKNGKLSVRFTSAADVYSYAMLFYEVLSGRIPFEEYKWNDYDHVLDGVRPTLPDYVPLWMRDLIHKCWHQDPSERPTFYRVWGEIESHMDYIDRSQSIPEPAGFPIVLEGPDGESYPSGSTMSGIFHWLFVMVVAYLSKYRYPEAPFWMRLCTFIFLDDLVRLFCRKMSQTTNSRDPHFRMVKEVHEGTKEVKGGKKEQERPAFQPFTGKKYTLRD